jgi:hypothetical protein
MHGVCVSKLLSAPGLLGTILSIFSCTPQPKGEPLIVETAVSPGGCKVSVNHERVTSQRLLRIASSGAYTWGIVRIQRNAPYKCIGAVILTLQQAGLATIKTQELPSL